MLKFLVLKSFRNRKFISFLCILSIALSLSLFLTVEKLRNGVEQSFTNSISNADLIVGARSGSLELLLYSIFHMGSATNNITIETYEKIKSHPAVAWTIPISLGDSYRGHRVVATDKNFLDHYQFYGDRNVEIKQGSWSNDVFDVVLGSHVAKSLGHKVGDSVVLSHGISESSILDHEKTPFKVKGILKSTGTPIDKSLFITLYGMEAIHVGWESGAPSYEQIDQARFSKENLKTTQITSFVLRTKNRIALLGLKHYISNYKNEALSGIIPAVVLTQLWGLLDQLEKAFLGISFFVIIIGFLTILISLYMSLNERQRELAILRSLGVSAKEITFLLFCEAFILSFIGVTVGFLLQYLLLFIFGPILEELYGFYLVVSKPTTRELIISVSFIGLGCLFGLVPALKAYKTSLNNGLIVK